MTPLPRPSPVDSRTGLIRWLFDLPVEPAEPRVFNAAVKMAATSRYNRHGCYDNNGGSGLTRAQARGAAIGEGLERYCASVYNARELRLGTARDVGGEYHVIAPDEHALFAADQVTPYSAFTPDTPIAWARGTSLHDEAPALVPACLVYMPYHPEFLGRGPAEERVGPAMSTGLACARSLDQALLGGLLEAVERDAFMITWLGSLSRTRLDIEASPQVADLYRRRLARDGLQYVLLDITSDVPIPVCLCVLVDWHRTPPMISVGAAAHLDPSRAACKAMLEAVQTREWAKYLGSGRPFDFAPDHRDIRQFEDHVALYAYGDMEHALRFLLDAPAAPDDRFFVTSASDQPATPREGLDHALEAVRGCGIDAVALDLTTADVADCGFHVAKVVAPQLQPLYADEHEPMLGGRRHREVPVRLGMWSRDDPPVDVNRTPHPFP